MGIKALFDLKLPNGNNQARACVVLITAWRDGLTETAAEGTRDGASDGVADDGRRLGAVVCVMVGGKEGRSEGEKVFCFEEGSGEGWAVGMHLGCALG